MITGGNDWSHHGKSKKSPKIQQQGESPPSPKDEQPFGAHPLTPTELESLRATVREWVRQTKKDHPNLIILE
jgi:hypothetical protein